LHGLGIAAATIFHMMMVSFSKRIYSKWCGCGLLAGLICTTVYILHYLGWFFNPGTANLANIPEKLVCSRNLPRCRSVRWVR